MNEPGETAIKAASPSTVGVVRTVTRKNTPVPYTVKLVNTGSGGVKIIGVELSNSTARGVVFNMAVMNGTAVWQFASCPTEISNPILAAIEPDLVIFKKADDVNAMAAALPQFYANIRAGFPRSDWIFNLTHEMAGGTNEEVATFLRNFAIANGQSAHDDRTWSGSYRNADANGWMYIDGTHRSNAGNDVAVGLLFSEAPISRALGARESMLHGAGLAIFRATQSSPTALADSVFTPVRFDTIYRDSAGLFNTSTHQFTAPVTGWYEFKAALNIVGASAGAEVVVSLFWNNVRITDLAATQRATTGGLGSLGPSGSDVLYLAAGDKVDVRVFASRNGMSVQGDIFSAFSGRQVPGS